MPKQTGPPLKLNLVTENWATNQWIYSSTLQRYGKQFRESSLSHFTFHSSLVADGGKQGGTTSLSEPGGNAPILHKKGSYRQHRKFNQVT